MFGLSRSTSEASLPRAALKLKLRNARGSSGRASFGLLAHLTEDVEIEMMRFFSAEDLAKLCATNTALREMALVVCQEQCKLLMGMADEEDELAELPMVKHLAATTGSGLPYFLHLISSCRAQTNLATLSLGEAHSCVVSKVGPGRTAVHTFGEGSLGQLGSGRSENSVIPMRVHLDSILPAGSSVVGVACGASHTSLLTNDGRILSFGLNNAGQLGDGTRNQRVVPGFTKDVRSGDGSTVKYAQIVAGRFYTAAITTEGRVAVFGEGLDIEHVGNSPLLPRGEIDRDERVVQLAAGQEHLLMLTDRDNLFAVGSGHQGKLGLARNLVEPYEESLLPEPERRIMSQLRTSQSARVPGRVALPSAARRIVHIAAGGNHSALVTGDGKLFTWGAGINGELGVGKFVRSEPQPVLVQLPPKTPFAVSVSCGKAHTAVLTSCGHVLTCGSGSYNQDGKENRFWATHSPQEICLGDLAHHKPSVSVVVCGGRHSALLDVQGNLFTFGDPMCTGRPLRAQTGGPNYLPRIVPINKDVTGTFRLRSI